MSEYEYELETGEGTLRTNDKRLMVLALSDCGVVDPLTPEEYQKMLEDNKASQEEIEELKERVKTRYQGNPWTDVQDGTISRDCSECSGTGSVGPFHGYLHTRECPKCDGGGIVHE